MSFVNEHSLYDQLENRFINHKDKFLYLYEYGVCGSTALAFKYQRFIFRFVINESIGKSSFDYSLVFDFLNVVSDKNKFYKLNFHEYHKSILDVIKFNDCSSIEKRFIIKNYDHFCKKSCTYGSEAMLKNFPPLVFL